MVHIPGAWYMLKKGSNGNGADINDNSLTFFLKPLFLHLFKSIKSVPNSLICEKYRYMDQLDVSRGIL